MFEVISFLKREFNAKWSREQNIKCCGETGKIILTIMCMRALFPLCLCSDLLSTDAKAEGVQVWSDHLKRTST